MTRKRYVKLLMSIGYSRNEANERSYACLCVGRSYYEDYSGPSMVCTRLGYTLSQSMACSAKTMQEALSNLSVEASRVSASLGKFVEEAIWKLQI